MNSRNRFVQKILIVDDSEMNRDILSEMLGNEYEIIEAENGEEAIAILQQKNAEISLVLLDIVMPVMDGYEVLSVMNSNNWISDVPVIMISSESSTAIIDRAYELGVTDFISRPFDALIVRRRVVNTILLYAKQKELEAMVAEQIYEKEKNSSLMVTILSHIVEFRNGESGLHVLHVQAYTEIMLRHLVEITDKYKLTNDDISLIAKASALHDIGKISISDEILNKPGRLTTEEFEIMKTHSSVGAAMLSELSVYENEPLVKVAYEICRWHHERYDGRGYPDGLKEEEIPISAQMVALADVYDALTSKRVYKNAFSHETAVNMILNGECGTFNPVVLECFKSVADDLEKESKTDASDYILKKEMINVTDEMLQHGEFSASERTLNMLKYERMKSNFFSTVSNEVWFEYTEAPAMITFSGYGAEKLGIKEYIMNPMESEELGSIINRKDILALSNMLRNTTPDQPVIQYDCEVNCNGNKEYVRIVCRSVWSPDDNAKFSGAMGKFVQIDEETGSNFLEDFSQQDALTGLWNYEASKKRIQRILANKKNEQYILAVIDIDGLENANEKYGHSFGDCLLLHMAERVCRRIRRKDIASRAGGDEILIFMECESEIEKAVNRIFAVLGEENAIYSVSVCMGVAKTEKETDSYEKLFHMAKQALQAAKNSGKGQLRFYDSSMENSVSELSPIDETSL